MVNEVTPGGNVVHLTDDRVPKSKYKEAPKDFDTDVSPNAKLEDISETAVVTPTVSRIPGILPIKGFIS